MEYRRPLPPRRGYAREFYEYCRKHELSLPALHRFKDLAAYSARPLCEMCLDPMGVGQVIGAREGFFMDHGDAADAADF